MSIIFEEIKKRNLPEEGQGNKFVIEEEKEYYCLYHFDGDSKDQILTFNLKEANSEKLEEKLKEIFKFFKYEFNKETKKWKKIKFNK